MKSDDKILKSELDFVKYFLLQQFGIDEAERQLLILLELLKKRVRFATGWSSDKTGEEPAMFLLSVILKKAL